MKYIQNRTNWCWVAACKVAGEQYKKNFTEFAFTLESPETEVAVSNLDGLRTDIVKRRNGIYFVDAWQSAILPGMQTFCTEVWREISREMIR